MNFSLIVKLIFINIKFFFYSIIVLIIFIEFLFQIIFLLNISFFKKPILFFNPYCEQSYWDNVKKSTFDEEIFSYHPILTMIKKKNQTAFNFNNIDYPSPKKNDLVFYGSSFIDHKYFIPYFSKSMNYAVKSYGLDQIFKSYDITKNYHLNDVIIFGFLLEDLDRVLFNKRNFPKLKYQKYKNDYQLTNVPIKLDYEENKKITSYSYNLIKNLIFLFLNDYDYKKSNCKIDIKKNLFKFFINGIIENVYKSNQKLIFITFNFKDDIVKGNWRHDFIKEQLSLKNIIHLDTKEILQKHMKNNNLQPIDYYSNEDFHLNELGNKLVAEELNILIKQYK